MPRFPESRVVGNRSTHNLAQSRTVVFAIGRTSYYHTEEGIASLVRGLGLRNQELLWRCDSISLPSSMLRIDSPSSGVYELDGLRDSPKAKSQKHRSRLVYACYPKSLKLFQ